jgi:hypothetical protein
MRSATSLATTPAFDFAGGGLRPGFKAFHARANSGDLMNRTDVFATTASTSGP